MRFKVKSAMKEILDFVFVKVTCCIYPTLLCRLAYKINNIKNWRKKSQKTNLSQSMLFESSLTLHPLSMQRFIV